ncbi:hypothetical protein COX59_00425 [Candidatus Beckwithbacteria bacterium CG_4_10_14_0_2_um_filter_47_25]|uniref:Uncharacterized protein n=1 Tax=Candidatus Beckwithbacteria bacterium CG_4_10_14_0_2_um_filter_47_25 TaxID=1974493 RepID=A0A2M7W7C7_9BACT|nr:MAG: hypothetical protein COX59_00425 [Candidatus Beckwithbacteria bacterium CG_4_10_14_0_2_um_filter_47_25]
MVNIEARAGLDGRLSAEVIPGALPVTETPFLRNEVLPAAELPAAEILVPSEEVTVFGNQISEANQIPIQTETVKPVEPVVAAMAMSALSLAAVACSGDALFAAGAGAVGCGILAAFALGTNAKQKAIVSVIGGVAGGFAVGELYTLLEAGTAAIGVTPGFCLGAAGLIGVILLIRQGIFKGNRIEEDRPRQLKKRIKDE